MANFMGVTLMLTVLLGGMLALVRSKRLARKRNIWKRHSFGEYLVKRRINNWK